MNKQNHSGLFTQEKLPFATHTSSTSDKHEPEHSIIILKRWMPSKLTPVFNAYWKFAAERQSIFFNRIQKPFGEWTQDAILKKYKFTNAYRASDRVSQYLIKHVIYEGDPSISEVFFRILLFKIFNKIQTWEMFKRELGGAVSYDEYSFSRFSQILAEAMNKKLTIFSSAYIMPTRTRIYDSRKKHENYLLIIEKMMTDRLPERIKEANSMQSVFELFRSYPMIGDFLAFQYTIDINYSELTDFKESSFVVPGPGAVDGIRKCFYDTGGLSDVDIIKFMADRQQEEFGRLNITFQDLWGRPLQLIDCQNIFCEIDKYSRVAFPEFSGVSGRTRIKQILKPNFIPISYFYPPKWGINEAVRLTLAESRPHEIP